MNKLCMNKLCVFLLLICCLVVTSCGTIALNSTTLVQPAQLNSDSNSNYTIVKSFKVNDKAGWIFGIIPANLPAGDNHTYFADFLEKQINDAGGDAVMNVKVRTQSNFGDFLINVVSFGFYFTRTVTVTGDIIKYN